MRNIGLYETAEHRFVLLNESEPGEEQGIRSNQYLVQHGNDGVLLDPGGFGVMPATLAELLGYLQPDDIRTIILSHQDPDIVGGLPTWLELTPAEVLVSEVWIRFLPHYGFGRHVQFRGIPDAGMRHEVAPGFVLDLVPAHFLHSEGHFNVFDPVSRILFSGDVGAGLMPEGEEHPYVDDLAAHLPYIEGFHRRYMGGNVAARSWAERVARLDPVLIAPQHGPVYRGAAVGQFIDWMRTLECGPDRLTESGAIA